MIRVRASLALWVALIAALAVCASTNSPSVATVGLLLFFAGVFLCYKSSKAAFYFSILFVVNWAWCVICVRHIETGAYISEQFRNGVATNGTSRLALLSIVFLAGIAVVFAISSRRADRDSKTLAQRIPNRLKQFELAVSAAAALVALALLVLGFLYGFPLLSGEARFSYWAPRQSLQAFEFAGPPVLAFCYGAIFSLRRGRRNVFVPLLLAVLQVLFSDKFSGPLQDAMFFATGFYSARMLDGRQSNKGLRLRTALLVVPLLVASFVASVVYGYMVVEHVDQQSVASKIEERALVLQGHVFYGVDLGVNVNKTISHGPTDFLRSDSPARPGGLTMLMYDVSPPAFALQMKEAGIRFTEGFPAITLATFGTWGAIPVQFVLGGLVGLVFLYLRWKLARLQAIAVVLALLFLENVVVNAFLMGETYYLLRVRSMALITFMIVEAAVTYTRERRVGKQAKAVSAVPPTSAAQQVSL